MRFLPYSCPPVNCHLGADNSLTRKYGRAGVGLAIVRKLSKLEGEMLAVTVFYGAGVPFGQRIGW